MNFQKYFGLSDQEKKLLSPNTGSAHHNTVKRIMGSGLDRKSVNLVAKTHTQKDHFHPKVTSCYKTKQDQNLTSGEADTIMKHYGIYPNDAEPKKAIKQLGVYLLQVAPNSYILTAK